MFFFLSKVSFLWTYFYRLGYSSIILFTIFSCSKSIITYNNGKEKYIGTYINQSNSLEIILLENSFLIKDEANYNNHLAVFNCPDTLAYGTWKLDNNYPFIKLYSNSMQYWGGVDRKVEETNIISKNDSIYFTISTPIEGNNEETKSIYYKIIIQTGDNIYDMKVNQKKFYRKNIALPMPKTKKIDSFMIEIYPIESVLGWKQQTPPRYYSTDTYYVKNKTNNYFQIHIPNLTSCYISAYILMGEYVKILDESKIEWKEDIYIRK